MQAGPGGLTIYSYYLEFSELKVTHYIRTDTIIKKAALVVIKTNDHLCLPGLVGHHLWLGMLTVLKFQFQQSAIRNAVVS